MIRATTVTRNDSAPADTVTLGYDDRYRRRMVMTGDGGTAFLLDLAEATELKGGDRLVLEDGREVAVRAKDEALMEAISPDPLHLARTAWHVGNRHLPCELHVDRLVLRHDHVIAEMLAHLGCEVRIITGPFQPEGGAYGVGRTHGHSH
ncbi:MAG: urease accessory protein UreE [Pseudomonadota bacterium]